MFGFNLNDEKGDPHYRELLFPELEQLVVEMKDYARTHTFDTVKAAKEAKADKRLRTEPTPGAVRVMGSESLDFVKEYNQFIRLGLHALQVCYYEMDTAEEGRVGQLTLVDNYGIPLEDQLVHGFVDLFMNYRATWWAMKTPPHVSVVLQKV